MYINSLYIIVRLLFNVCKEEQDVNWTSIKFEIDNNDCGFERREKF